ncbi:MAG: hypothetical protein AB9903_26480 [Vulcanimicrobiota bacterium]
MMVSTRENNKGATMDTLKNIHSHITSFAHQSRVPVPLTKSSIAHVDKKKTTENEAHEGISTLRKNSGDRVELTSSRDATDIEGNTTPKFSRFDAAERATKMDKIMDAIHLVAGDGISTAASLVPLVAPLSGPLGMSFLSAGSSWVWAWTSPNQYTMRSAMGNIGMLTFPSFNPSLPPALNSREQDFGTQLRNKGSRGAHNQSTYPFIKH